jgi:hypothetical protein
LAPPAQTDNRRVDHRPTQGSQAQWAGAPRFL